MKHLKLIAVAVGLILVVNATAGAITFNRPYVGPVFFKIRNFDMGAIYPLLASGTKVGGTGNMGLDVAALDALQLAGATGARQTNSGLGDGMDDSWGIAQVTQIDPVTGPPLWTPDTTGDGIPDRELTMLFYGEQDFYVHQISATDQIIAGVNMRFEMYEDNTPDFDETLGSGGRTGYSTYTGVTDGTMVLSGHSVPGHIRLPNPLSPPNPPNVNEGGTPTEFENTINVSQLINPPVVPISIGGGVVYFELDGGTEQIWYDPEMWGSPDYFQPLPANVGLPGVADCDVRLTFTAWVPANASDWLIRSNDPGLMYHVIPEPITMLGLFLGVGSLAGYIRKRRQA